MGGFLTPPKRFKAYTASDERSSRASALKRALSNRTQIMCDICRYLAQDYVCLGYHFPEACLRDACFRTMAPSVQQAMLADCELQKDAYGLPDHCAAAFGNAGATRPPRAAQSVATAAKPAVTTSVLPAVATAVVPAVTTSVLPAVATAVVPAVTTSVLPAVATAAAAVHFPTSAIAAASPTPVGVHGAPGIEHGAIAVETVRERITSWLMHNTDDDTLSRLTAKAGKTSTTAVTGTTAAKVALAMFPAEGQRPVESALPIAHARVPVRNEDLVKLPMAVAVHGQEPERRVYVDPLDPRAPARPVHV